MDWHSTEEDFFNALRWIKVDDSVVPPVTWKDYIKAFRRLFSPPPHFLALVVHSITSPCMKDTETTDEFVIVVRDTYSRLHDKARGIFSPRYDIQ